jgi:hypothetical protein
MCWTRLETCIHVAAQLLGGSSRDAVCAGGGGSPTPGRQRPASVALVATSTSLVKAGPTPAFMLARVSPLAGGVAACVRQRQLDRAARGHFS